NIYGAFSEKGYIECHGFPVFFFRIFIEDKVLKFEGNNKKIFSIQELNFFYDAKERLFAIPNEQKFIKYGFSKTVLNQLSNYLNLTENGEYNLIYEEVVYPVKRFEFQFEVTVPLIL
ncbi:MAG: hypothetical protein N3A69_16390, partial [Leptospiraceae bacterium]|nr:hypothetical protein [Leptospiraceae bacterium]